MQIGFLVLLFVLGSCFGSFLCCQARRLHLKESSKGKKKSSLSSRSICLHCNYQLKWYDNIPIISWLALRGKCRKCHRKIGLAELISELGMGLAFLLPAIGAGLQFDQLFANYWDFVFYLAYLILILPLSFLAIYDGLYGELPTRWLIVSIVIAAITAVAKLIINANWGNLGADIGSLALAVVVLGGLYLVLHLVSRGKWVGDGDWLLGTAIALALESPWLALIALFIANLLASLVMLPTFKKNKHKKIHLGPFLVTAFVITYAFSDLFFALLS